MPSRCSLSRSIIILIVAGCLCGCSLLDRSLYRGATLTPVLGTVRTGGPYAVPRVLPIPPGGLTLSDAVEASLRPGITAHSGAPVIQRSVNSALPVTEQPAKIPDGVSAALQFTLPNGLDLEGLKKLEEARQVLLTFAKDTGALATEHLESFEKHLQQAMLTAANEGAFRPQIPDDPNTTKINVQRKLRLKQEIVALIALGDLVVLAEPNDSQLLAAHTRICKTFAVPENDARHREDLLQRLQKARADGVFRLQGDTKLLAIQQLVAPSANAPDAAPLSVQFTPTTGELLVDHLAVAVTRVSGRILIIPLQEVRTYLPGDIALQDGDRVEVILFDQTSAAQKPEQSAPATVAVTSWSDAKGLVATVGAGNPTLRQLIAELNEQHADVVVLRRLTANGLLQEYVLPRNDEKRLSETYLRHGDLVHLDVLNLMPLIRNSHDLKMPAPAQAKTCLGMRANRRGTTPLGRLDSQCKQWTGVSSADVAQGASRGLQNVGGMIFGTPR